MRVISGTKRGMNLFSPTDKNTRPTESKVRESIFNVLSDIDSQAYVLDLFAGSGAIGIEFLSRGADFLAISEYSRDNMKIINQNIIHTGLANQVKLFQGDYKKNLYNIKNTIKHKFDYIYIDPPYDKKDYYFKALDLIKKLELLDDEGLIILESRDKLDEELLSEWEIVKSKRYGTVNLYFLIGGGKNNE